MSSNGFISECGLHQSEIDKAGITSTQLQAIHADHVERRDVLEGAGEVVMHLLRTMGSVHSVRMRVKNPKGLVRKVVRKRLENPQRIITPQNYKNEITDLVGIRALHLYKEDWEPIHQFIMANWVVHERPIAYYREGDPPQWIKRFEKLGCDVEQHPRSYRSVHYLLPVSSTKEPTIVEVQVRTLIEEAWSEIDHRINYPDKTKHIPVLTFLLLFNRFAGTADEMGSFANYLEQQLSEVDRGAKAETTEVAAFAGALAGASYMREVESSTILSDLIDRITVNQECSQCGDYYRTSGADIIRLCSRCRAAQSRQES